jgi:hypothetical protein
MRNRLHLGADFADYRKATNADGYTACAGVRSETPLESVRSRKWDNPSQLTCAWWQWNAAFQAITAIRFALGCEPFHKRGTTARISSGYSRGAYYISDARGELPARS